MKETEAEDIVKPHRKPLVLLPGGLAGTGPHGSFFERPGWVDESLAPGHTSQEAVVAAPGYWKDKITGKSFFFSPNLVWITIALTDYLAFPYDFSAAKSFDRLDWVLHRSVHVIFMPFPGSSLTLSSL